MNFFSSPFTIFCVFNPPEISTFIYTYPPSLFYQKSISSSSMLISTPQSISKSLDCRILLLYVFLIFLDCLLPLLPNGIFFLFLNSYLLVLSFCSSKSKSEAKLSKSIPSILFSFESTASFKDISFISFVPFKTLPAYIDFI